jgi:glycosyltransferase involved in cell wall biosynthesis
MNILMVNWAWYPTGGDWTYIESIKNIYELNGHNIIPFSMHHEKNISTPYDNYFIKNINYQKLNAEKNLKSGFDVLLKTIYSFEARKQIQLLLDKNKIDIVQLNSITNSITPSIIPIIKKKRIPIAWRILDYKLICPNAYLYNNNRICEACFKHKYINCVLKKCKKNSFLASTVAAIGSYFYYIFPFDKNVDIYLFQSQFTRDMYVKFGYDVKKTHIIENPFDSKGFHPNYIGKGYILYFGRLSKEKGVVTLLKAMKELPDVELKIVGDGPEYNNYTRYIIENSIKNVTFLGPKWNKDLEQIIEDCEFVIVPSEWYEPSPYVVLQSFSYGKPVVASNLGGLSDLILNNENGLLFNGGNIQELTHTIKTLIQNKMKIRYMGIKAKQLLDTKYSPERYYTDTIRVFEDLIKSKSSL